MVKMLLLRFEDQIHQTVSMPSTNLVIETVNLNGSMHLEKISIMKLLYPLELVFHYLPTEIVRRLVIVHVINRQNMQNTRKVLSVYTSIQLQEIITKL